MPLPVWLPGVAMHLLMCSKWVFRTILYSCHGFLCGFQVLLKYFRAFLCSSQFLGGFWEVAKWLAILWNILVSRHEESLNFSLTFASRM